MKVDENTLLIRSPRIPNLNIFDHLETDWFIFLVQFILHRRLTIDQLERILHYDIKEVERKLKILIRAGIITKKTKDIFEINTYLHPHIKQKLEEMDML
jgi:predicted transcriptional regulator